jgi:hypothetical protein
MIAFTDIRNLLIDREIGTNILSFHVTYQEGKHFNNFLKFLKKVGDETEKFNIIDLIYNYHSLDGYNLGMKVI